MSSRHTPRGEVQIYRDAAKVIEDGKLLDNGRGSCSAITQAAEPQMHHSEAYDALCCTPIVTNYVNTFCPRGRTGGYWGTEWGATHQEQDDCRILALCFMAAMVEAGDV